MREDTTPGNSGNRALFSNRWTLRGTLLHTILNNWAVFQGLWVDILEEKVDSEILFLNTNGSCFNAYGQLIFYSIIHTRHVIKVSKLQKYVFYHYKVREEVSFHMLLKKMTPNYLKKDMFRVIIRKKKLM